MRRRLGRQNLLQQYELEASTSMRLVARSDNHDFANMRMRPEDVQALRSKPSTLCSPLIALFSTSNPREPVNLRSSETLYVRLQAEKEAETEETDAAETGVAETEAEHTETAKTEAAQTEAAQTEAAQTEATQEKSDKKQRYRAAARRRVTSAWTPLRLVAHHSYVAGMRVSGIVHRAIVRVEFDKQ
jgi:hypothetical protein